METGLYEIIERVADVFGILVGLFVLSIIFRARQTSIGRRYPRFHKALIITVIIYLFSLALSVVGWFIENEFVGEVLHHVVMFLVVIGLVFTFRSYRSEIVDDERLRGIISPSPLEKT